MEQLDFYSAKIEEIYQNLQVRILEIIATRLFNIPAGEDVTIPEWQVKALAESQQMSAEVLRAISQETGISEDAIKNAIYNSGYDTQKEVDKLMSGHRQVPLYNPMDTILATYVMQAQSNIDNLINETLLSRNGTSGTVIQVWRDIINQTSAEVMTGVSTLDDALSRTLYKWGEKGIPSGFVDRAGRQWNIQTYAKASIKSTVNNTMNAVRLERLKQYGVTTVVVTSHPSARPACSKIQGHVVDLRPQSQIPADSKYKSIYDPYWGAKYGTAGGHRGVNCTHMHIPFDPDVNENNQVKYKPSKAVDNFKKEQGQRVLENRIRKTKTKIMLAKAGNRDQDVDKFKKVLASQQKQMLQYTRKNKLKRKPKREQVKIPLDTLKQGT